MATPNTTLALLLTLILFITSAKAAYNVLDYGAKPNGKIDSAKPFLAAWAAACRSPSPATVHVPSGRFLLNKLAFRGPCRSPRINFRIFGTLVAPSYTVIGTASQWILFSQVDGLSINGGILDGQATTLWACKLLAGIKNCPRGAPGVTFRNVKISATGNSPNTDGVHIYMSKGVTITGSTIKTGDDCISIGPGSSNLWIEGVFCGPGTQNGVRIKTWARPSYGFVQGIVFENIVMRNVQNPIVIDQNYCPYNRNCLGQQSGIKISNVKYRNIKGTSATPIAVRFDCSRTDSCTGISLQNIQLTYMKKAAFSYCRNADGGAAGVVIPRSCL
ncbi:hypothetical protein QJS10_CPB19g00760 [Acorus calamus]|uniref:Polygalacturonase n=1 Tax=Acorus calamus TaxID=4465 RepID=A0AAV9CHX7_ACOCL|nr:hypothetical protein QJS10_CPB19g00760 [Acorus calamus]